MPVQLDYRITAKVTGMALRDLKSESSTKIPGFRYPRTGFVPGGLRARAIFVESWSQILTLLSQVKQ